ncbi:MAG: hypothetical protein RSB50_08110 [Cetobacterium sp.]
MISEILTKELLKLSKSEWDKLKVNIDYLYDIQIKKNEKKLFLDEDIIKNSLNRCPYPITHQQSE